MPNKVSHRKRILFAVMGAFLLMVVIQQVYANVILVGTEVMTLGGGYNGSQQQVQAYFKGEYNSDDLPTKWDIVVLTLRIDNTLVKSMSVPIRTPVGSVPGTIVHADWAVAVGPGTPFGTGWHTATFTRTYEQTDPREPDRRTLTYQFYVP